MPLRKSGLEFRLIRKQTKIPNPFYGAGWRDPFELPPSSSRFSSSSRGFYFSVRLSLISFLFENPRLNRLCFLNRRLHRGWSVRNKQSRGRKRMRENKGSCERGRKKKHNPAVLVGLAAQYLYPQRTTHARGSWHQQNNQSEILVLERERFDGKCRGERNTETSFSRDDNGAISCSQTLLFATYTASATAQLHR